MSWIRKDPVKLVASCGTATPMVVNSMTDNSQDVLLGTREAEPFCYDTIDGRTRAVMKMLQKIFSELRVRN